MPDRLETFINGLRSSIGADRPLETQQVARRKMSRILDACGWKNRSPARLLRLSEALDDAGIYASVDLRNTDLGLDTTVRFALEPFPSLGQVYQTERALGYHLGKYPSELQRALPSLVGLDHLYGGNKPERGYSYLGARHRPDLVFRAADGRYLVFELERTDPDQESVAQLAMYARAVRENVAPAVVAVLVTARPRHKSREAEVRGQLAALEGEFETHWLWYDAKVALDHA